MSINIDFMFVVEQSINITITTSLILYLGHLLLKNFATKYIKNIFVEKLVDYNVEKQQINIDTLNIYEKYFDIAETAKKPAVADTNADNYKEGIRIYKRLYSLYRKIQDSREVIKYKSGNDKRQEIIDELYKEINDVRKDIYKNSEYLEGLIDYVYNIPTYLTEDLSALTNKNVRNEYDEDLNAKNENGENITLITVRSVQNKYDREKLLEALLKAAEWIRKNMEGDSTHNDVD